eukprot:5778686-Prymnesium_polylepis.1
MTATFLCSMPLQSAPHTMAPRATVPRAMATRTTAAHWTPTRAMATHWTPTCPWDRRATTRPARRRGSRHAVARNLGCASGAT